MTIETDFFEGKNQNVTTSALAPQAFFDTQELREDLDLPEREKQERAFYASSFNPQENIKQTYALAKQDLDTQGYSDFVDDETKAWKDEQIGMDEGIIKDIISDPTIPITQKKTILNTYRMGGYISGNLRDKHLQKTAALDNQDSNEDKNMQELLQKGLLRNSQRQKELEVSIYEYQSNLDPTITGFAAGAARDFIPGMWNTGNALSAKNAAKYFGYNDQQSFNFAARAFFMGGTYSKEIREAFNNTLDPVQKKDFFMHLMEGAKQLPGFDYNAWSILQPQIEQQPMEWWEEGLLNLASIGDLVGVGSFLRNPVRWMKGLYTYEDSKLAQGIMKLVAPISKSIPQAERVEPHIVIRTVSEQNAKASNEATGTSNGIQTGTVDPDANYPSMFRSSRDNLHNVIPQVKPTSPIGLASIANPKQAREMDKAAIMDADVARSMGTSQGEIIGSHLLPKLDDDFVKNNPDISKDIQEMDKRVNELFGETAFDPFLVNVTERADEKFKLFKAFSETHGAYYQQANSSFRESLGAIEGKARYGRNADFGFTTLEDAELAKKQIDESFISEGTQSFNSKIVKENEQHYIDLDWKRTYDPFSARLFGAESASSSFAGINTSGISKSAQAKYIFPPTTRLDEWVTKGAFNAAVQGSKAEGEFLRFISNEIHTTKFPAEFTKATEWTQENGKWMNKGELAAMFPNLHYTKDLPNLERAYQSFKRLTEYNYLWADRKNTNDMLAGGFNRGIYDKDGIYKGGAKETDQVPDSVKQVWDFDADGPTLRPTKDSGRQIVQLNDPIHAQGNRYEYGVVGGNTKLDILPHHTLPKLEAYISRKNIEPWYVIAIPKSLKVNGTAISNHDELVKYARTIGAGKSKEEVEAFAKKLQGDFPDHIVDIKQERGDIGDSILTDYKVYKEMTDYGKKRGERLPTLTGFARLEEPLVAQTNSMRSVLRLNAWQNYQEIFQKNFMAAYGKFLPDGKFPNVLTDLKPAPVMTPKDLDDFQIAQRNFEQYANSQYKINMGDEVYKNVLHKVADVVEGSPLAGKADAIREIANKGDLGLKSAKTIDNTLFINLNSLAQWIVQPQAILEFSAVEKGFRDQMTMIPGLLINMLAKASDVKPYRGVLEDLSHFGIKDKAEFKAIADAIYKSGLPQSVDMNMMLHGGLDDMAKGLNPTVADQLGKTLAYIPQKASAIGKAIGYTPAQMTADIGGWLFAKARWQRMNPGKNWNTPEHIAQITADGWDIMGSMHTRAGALPYQDGYMSLFFRFQSILHKQMFGMFASKTLKKAPGELVHPMVKLAGARMAIYGVYGVPAHAMIDSLVQNMSDSDIQGDYNRYKGGLLNLATNTTLDVMLFDPNQTMPTDLNMSDRIGPMPDTVPYYDVMSDLIKFAYGGTKSQTSIPFVNAAGSVYEAARDFTNIFRATEVGTVDALQMAMVEAAEASSGYKNWVKAQMIMEMQDKANKFDKKLGLELTTKHAVAQMFGVISQQELNQYKMSENKKEREEFIEQRASQIHQDLIKLRTKVGTPDFEEWVRRTKVLNTFTPEAMQEAILMKVLQKDKEDFMTTQQSNINYIRDNAQEKNDKYIEEMLGYLKSCDSEGCKTNLNRLINNNIIKGAQ